MEFAGFKFIHFLITTMGLRTALFGTKPPELTVCPYHRVMQNIARFFGVRIVVEGPQTEIRKDEVPKPPIRLVIPEKKDRP